MNVYFDIYQRTPFRDFIALFKADSQFCLFNIFLNLQQFMGNNLSYKKFTFKRYNTSIADNY